MANELIRFKVSSKMISYTYPTKIFFTSVLLKLKRLLYYYYHSFDKTLAVHGKVYIFISFRVSNKTPRLRRANWNRSFVRIFVYVWRAQCNENIYITSSYIWIRKGKNNILYKRAVKIISLRILYKVFSTSIRHSIPIDSIQSCRYSIIILYENTIS